MNRGIFAAYTAHTDHEIGRVIQAVEDMGELDNTLIIYICGDNGTSPEGSLSGTYNTYTAYNGVLDVPEALQLLHYEDWGSSATYPARSAFAWLPHRRRTAGAARLPTPRTTERSF